MADRAPDMPVDPAVLELADRALVSTLEAKPDRFSLTTLKGDASSRSYHRVRLQGRDPRTLVIMQLATDPLKSDEFTEWDPPEYPFVLVQRYLDAGGLPVPRIHGARPQDGWLVLEDLGDATLETVLAAATDSERQRWYERAIDLMVRWHGWWSASARDNPVKDRSFSRNLLSWEIDHYVEWGIEARLGRTLEPPERSRLAGLFAPLVDELAEVPRALVHRDFQSRNLMVVDRGRGLELVLIDFQDALMGPAVYDAVALLCDSYVDIDEDLQAAMIERLRAAAHPGVDPATFTRWFTLQAIQRKLKDAGRFVFIDRVKGNPSFLPFVGRSLEYARRALERSKGLESLHSTLQRLGGLDEP